MRSTVSTGWSPAARRLDESGAQLFNPPRNRINLAQLVESLAAGHATVAGRRGIRLNLQIRTEVTVLAGRSLLETVLENLLENAIGFARAWRVHQRRPARDRRPPRRANR